MMRAGHMTSLLTCPHYHNLARAIHETILLFRTQEKLTIPQQPILEKRNLLLHMEQEVTPR